jgi:S-DNA-T family DNA segregation ATPase FtsK/SpoIIIE
MKPAHRAPARRNGPVIGVSPAGAGRRDRNLREAGGLTVLASSLFLFLSIYTEPPEGAVGLWPNWCGSVGRSLHAAFVGLWGFPAALLLASLLGAFGYRTLRGRRALPAPLSMLGIVVSVMALSGFLTLATRPERQGLGGSVGFVLHETLVPRLGIVGSGLLLLTTGLSALLLATDRLLPHVAAAVLARVRVAFQDPPAPRPVPAAAAALPPPAAMALSPAVPRKSPDAPPAREPVKAQTPPPAPPPPPPPAPPPPKPKPVVVVKTPPPPAPAKKVEPKPAPARKAPSGKEDYRLPPIELLEVAKPVNRSAEEELIRKTSEVLEKKLSDFKIQAEVVEIDKGPVVTLYELQLGESVKVNRVAVLADDLAIALRAPNVRLVAPIPGKTTVGIEVPNLQREQVRLRELREIEDPADSPHVLPLFLGKDASGRPLIADLTRMPHLLIAGSTGSGKSVCMNAIIMSLLLTRRPEEVQLILVDPKMVELSLYREIPHLLTPVVTDMKRAPIILDWAVEKMEERYHLLAAAGVRDIGTFNKVPAKTLKERLKDEYEEGDEIPTHLPYIVLLVDELADLMMSSGKEVEEAITRLAQKSRAVGIHLIVATQRPSVDVITGLIKANMPTRIAFRVAAKVDSRVVLDVRGAELLLGTGDMLYLPMGSSTLSRAQGTFVSDEEVRKVVGFLKEQKAPRFDESILSHGQAKTPEGAEADELYEEAVRIVLETGRGSTTLLQRKLGIGYTRAARLVDLMRESGLVGKYKGSVASEVLMSWEEYQSRKGAPAA